MSSNTTYQLGRIYYFLRKKIIIALTKNKFLKVYFQLLQSDLVNFKIPRRGCDYKLVHDHQVKGKRISILCPTRGRVNNIARLVNSIEVTTEDLASVDIIFYVDQDDVVSVDYFLTDFTNRSKVDFKLLVGRRITLSNMWNACYSESSAEIFMLAGDDLVFLTPGWNTSVENMFRNISDKIGFVYGDDGKNGAKFGTHGFLHFSWCKTIGYFVPPHFSSDFNDVWLNEVADALGRRFFLPILIKHIHPSSDSNVPFDRNYVENALRGKSDDVVSLYGSLKNARDLDILKLKTKILESTLEKMLSIPTSES